jgi:hypothetical protein
LFYRHSKNAINLKLTYQYQLSPNDLTQGFTSLGVQEVNKGYANYPDSTLIENTVLFNEASHKNFKRLV